MAAYPNSVASDNDLIVAGNRDTTTLLGTISAGTTTIVVTSGVFPENSVVTIENERILLGTSTVSGTYGGCTRGYDNSTAASHTSGVAVNANVVAAHHNVLRTEIQAIENTLGANLSFVQKVFNPGGFTFSQSPTQNIPGGGPALVILRPPPAGITANSVNNHYLYITDGGSSEAVLLTSVATGADFTTVGFTPVNSHTATQWSIGSATAGIQEAYYYAVSQGGGGVQIPYSATTLRQRVFIGNGLSGVSFVGERVGCALFVNADHPAFYARGANQNWALRGFAIIGNGSVTTASLIDVDGVTSGGPTIDDVTTAGGYHGIKVANTIGITIRNCYPGTALNDGINGDTLTIAQIYDNTANFNTGAGINIIGNGTACVLTDNFCGGNARGIYLQGTQTSLLLDGNVCVNSGTANFADAMSSRTGCLLGDNLGADTVIGAVTAAATITLPSTLTKTITISGTTTIDTINGAWGTGHEVVFFCPNALTFSAAGNIKVALTTTYANQPVRARYNASDSKWYVS